MWSVKDMNKMNRCLSLLKKHCVPGWKHIMVYRIYYMSKRCKYDWQIHCKMAKDQTNEIEVCVCVCLHEIQFTMAKKIKGF